MKNLEVKMKSGEEIKGAWNEKKYGGSIYLNNTKIQLSDSESVNVVIYVAKERTAGQSYTTIDNGRPVDRDLDKYIKVLLPLGNEYLVNGKNYPDYKIATAIAHNQLTLEAVEVI